MTSSYNGIKVEIKNRKIIKKFETKQHTSKELMVKEEASGEIKTMLN